MKWYLYFPMLVMFLGIGELIYQIYKMIVLDAEGRGLKHPRLWGILAAAGNNSSGLFVYLLGRRNYPRTLTAEAEAELKDRKRKSLVGLVFLAAGAAVMVGMCIFML